MSKFQAEVIPFPWTTVIVALWGIVWIYLIFREIGRHLLWYWNNRLPLQRSTSRKSKSKSKKKKPQKKRKVDDEDDEDEEDESSSSSSE